MLAEVEKFIGDPAGWSKAHGGAAEAAGTTFTCMGGPHGESKTQGKGRQAKTKNQKRRSSPNPPRLPKHVSRSGSPASHHRDEDFDYGLRPYSAYRDLGIASATHGMVQAHVTSDDRKPFTAEEVATSHHHDVESPDGHALKVGSAASRRTGDHTFHAGSCWSTTAEDSQHTVRGYSDDCELLEIVLPADFETVTTEVVSHHPRQQQATRHDGKYYR